MMEKTTPHIRRELYRKYHGYVDMIDLAVEQMKIYSIRNMPTSANALTDRNLAMCYPLIIACSDYPSVRHYVKTEARTISISRRERIDLGDIPWEERAHIAVIGCYSVLRNYAVCGKGISFLDYVENRLPLKYIRLLQHETKECKTGRIYYHTSNHTQGDLPQSPEEYINMYVKDNLSEFTKTHFPYLGRTNMYRIIRKLDIS
jgi:hypothetical protein